MRRYLGIYRGVIVSRNSDGTYILQVPAVYGTVPSPPAYLCHQETTPIGFPTTGVFVLFEQGDAQFPIIFGTWQ